MKRVFFHISIESNSSYSNSGLIIIIVTLIWEFADLKALSFSFSQNKVSVLAEAHLYVEPLSSQPAVCSVPTSQDPEGTMLGEMPSFRISDNHSLTPFPLP